MTGFLEKALRIRKVLIGKDVYISRQIKQKTLTLGNRDARWTFIPELVSEKSIVYSIGIGTDISFDTALIEKIGCEVHAFDPTPKTIDWLKSRPATNKFKFSPFGLAHFDGIMDFFLPNKTDHVSGSLVSNEAANSKTIAVQMKRLKTIMNEFNHRRLDILKMDVEGSEYRIIDDILENQIVAGQLLIEFHHRFREIGIARTKDAVRKLNRAGYKIFYVSPNGEEISFVNQKFYRE
ncbi:MAG: FkbM family methyltransferase [Bacteroidales bacterium]|nr:FkbM family methyltransferase [Bacteroidales bacterium]MBN2821247.1 FkbM family methyltransferase [Bacteroidales bacterium]